MIKVTFRMLQQCLLRCQRIKMATEIIMLIVSVSERIVFSTMTWSSMRQSVNPGRKELSVEEREFYLTHFQRSSTQRSVKVCGNENMKARCHTTPRFQRLANIKHEDACVSLANHSSSFESDCKTRPACLKVDFGWDVHGKGRQLLYKSFDWKWRPWNERTSGRM